MLYIKLVKGDCDFAKITDILLYLIHISMMWDGFITFKMLQKIFNIDSWKNGILRSSMMERE